MEAEKDRILRSRLPDDVKRARLRDLATYGYQPPTDFGLPLQSSKTFIAHFPVARVVLVHAPPAVAPVAVPIAGPETPLTVAQKLLSLRPTHSWDSIAREILVALGHGNCQMLINALVRQAPDGFLPELMNVHSAQAGLVAHRMTSASIREWVKVLVNHVYQQTRSFDDISNDLQTTLGAPDYAELIASLTRHTPAPGAPPPTSGPVAPPPPPPPPPVAPSASTSHSSPSTGLNLSGIFSPSLKSIPQPVKLSMTSGIDLQGAKSKFQAPTQMAIVVAPLPPSTVPTMAQLTLKMQGLKKTVPVAKPISAPSTPTDVLAAALQKKFKNFTPKTPIDNDTGDWL